MTPPHYLIAIVGGSCSGKTTLAETLAHDLAPGPVPIIAEDDYYLCSSTIPAFDPATCNFDIPEAKDHALLLAHLRALRSGSAIDKPLYDFATHRRKAETERVAPANFVIAEGMHLLASEELRALFDLKVYLETDEATRRGRRMIRDASGRERSADFILEQFDRHVAPMHALYVEPQAAYADLIIDYDPDVLMGDRARPILTAIFGPER